MSRGNVARNKEPFFRPHSLSRPRAWGLVPLAVFLTFILSATFAFADDDADNILSHIGNRMSNTYHRGVAKGKDWLDMGDEARESYPCTDPAFFMIHLTDQTSGEKSWMLKGVVHTPKPGYQYRFTYLGARGPEAFSQLVVGTLLSQMQPPAGAAPEMQVAEKFGLPPGTGLFHVQVQGLNPMPTEFRCDITQTNQTK